MKFKSPILSNVSGSMGGATYSRNRFGLYIRNRSTPVNPNTDRQAAVRQWMQQLTQRWSQVLTDLQRIAWNLYGSSTAMVNVFGDTIYLTGFNHFLRSNVARGQAGATIIDDGPVIFELPEADPTFAFTASEATQLISFTFDPLLAWANESGGHLIKFQGRPQNPQRYFFGGPWRLLGTIDGDDTTPPTSPDDEAIEFAIAQGQKEWCYARISRLDGRLSEPFRNECTIGA